jgi:hypothetical protein
MAEKQPDQPKPDQPKRTIPPLRKKGRAPRADSLAAALHWDKIHQQASDQAASDQAAAGDQAPTRKPED